MGGGGGGYRALQGCYRDTAMVLSGCCRDACRDAGGMLQGCCRDARKMLQGCREDAAGMQEASCRTLSHGSLTSKECLALKLTQTSHFISPEYFRRKQVLISVEALAAGAGLSGRSKQLP